MNKRLEHLREQFREKQERSKVLRQIDAADMSEIQAGELRGLITGMEKLAGLIDAEIESDKLEARNNGTSFQVGDDLAGKKPFSTLGEQLLCIRSAMSPSGKVDARLHEIENRASGLSEGSDSGGGFLLQQDFRREIYSNMLDAAPLLDLVTKFQVSSNGIKIPAENETSRVDGSRHGGVRGYWLSEAGEKTASKPTFRQIDLSLKKVAALIYCTDELLQDVFALGGYLQKVGADELGFKVQDALVRGDGVGKPTGFMSATCCVEVAKEDNQAADTVVWPNIVAMWKRLPARCRKTAVWLINQDVEAQLYQMCLTVGTGGSAVFLPSGGASQAPYSTLLGRPIIPIEQCSTLGDAGDIMLIDPKSYFLAEKSTGIQTDVSIHVRFVYDESVFRFVYRVDGCPAIESAITPYKGSNTLSPFVKLAERAQG